jgi:hypothetical protein
MICNHLSSLLGLTCHPLNDDGSVAMIETPFQFEDGDAIPVFVEHIGQQVRFFDDGAVFMHFMGRGVSLSNANQTRFIKTAAEAHGAAFNADGEVEVFSDAQDAPAAFARYLAAMMAVVRWEKDHTGASTDAALFVDEVAQCLAAWRKDVEITRNPVVTGITGKEYTLHFDIAGTYVLAIGTSAAAAYSALHKLVDIRSLPANAGLKTLVVLDDRHDAEAARREGLVLSGASPVMDMTALQRQAGMSMTMQ